MKTFYTLLLVSSTYFAFGQTAHLLKDINPGTDGSFEFSLDRAMIEFQGKLFFSAKDAEHGLELWTYDGDSVSLFKDINPGAGDSDCDHFYHFVDKLIFVANDGEHGDELWISDGTPEGTAMVIDLLPGPENGVINCCNGDLSRTFIVFNDELYFNANIGNNRRRFYKSDGTAAGTIELAMLGGQQRSAGGMTIFNNELFFNVTFEGFWKTDGTSAGTVQIAEMDHEGGDLEPFYMYDMGDYLIMVNEFEWDLWRTDGTLEGTTLIMDMVRPGAQNNQGLYFTNYNDVAYFSGADAPDNTELWRSDGTESGTYEVIDVEDNTAFIPIYPRKKVVFNDLLYYIGGKDETGFQIYKSDGTEQGTEELINLDENFNAQVYFQSDLVATDDFIFFVAGRPFNRELWVTDGSADGTFEIEVNPNGESTPERLFLFQDKLLFFANGDGVGYELHYVDLTELTTSTKQVYRNASIPVYPNPTSSTLQIEMEESENAHIRIYDLLGNMVLETPYSNQISIGHLHDGPYVLHIVDLRSRETMVQKIFKVK